MERITVKIGEGGVVTIPAHFLDAMGVKDGDEITITLDGRELKLYSYQQAVKRAQEIVRRYIPEGRMLSEELIRERREEAARE